MSALQQKIDAPMNVPCASINGSYELALLQLALKFLVYVIHERPALVHAALTEQWQPSAGALALPTWWSDLCVAAAALPVPVHIDMQSYPTTDSVQKVLTELEGSLTKHLWGQVVGSRRMPLIQHRLHRAAPAPDRATLKLVCIERPYLRLLRRRQRDALCLLMLSEHPLAIEQLRRRHPTVLRNCRICRFCKSAAEIQDEAHVLLGCAEQGLTARREAFLNLVVRPVSALQKLHARLAKPAFLDVLLSMDGLALGHFADYVADIFERCETTPDNAGVP
ncbi:hypothetical protein C8Q78DRAFT_992897 [Trametes maxima]|nr:hypothetical protein C8Q78DRAFT_992897 [Trametes maxima]